MLEIYLEKLLASQDLTSREASSCASLVLEGKCNEGEIVELLTTLKDKGESVSEIVGFAKTMLDNAVPVHRSGPALDLCGTGGSGLERFNVSTTVAFILASDGVSVAKHGNKGSRKANGSFDLIEELGFKLNTTAEEEAELLKNHHLCFIYARNHHPAMRHVAAARAKLGGRSIFNLLGPICNPARVPLQMVGVANNAVAEKLSEVFLQLPHSERVMLVCGEPGIDEVSISGNTSIWTVEHGEVRYETRQPQDFGTTPTHYADLPCGDCKTNAELFRQLLAGAPLKGLRNLICVNAALAFELHDPTLDARDAFLKAEELLLSGKVRDFVANYPSRA